MAAGTLLITWEERTAVTVTFASMIVLSVFWITSIRFRFPIRIKKNRKVRRRA